MQGKAIEIISDYQAQDIRRTVTQSLLRAPEDSNEFEDKSTDFGSKIKEKEKERETIIRTINKTQHQIKEYAGEIISDKNKINEIDFNKINPIEELISEIDSKINEINESKNLLFNKLNNIYDDIKTNKDVLKIEKSITDLENKWEDDLKKLLIMEESLNKISNKIRNYEEDKLEISHKLDQRDYSIPLKIYNPTDICDRCGQKLPSQRIKWEKESPPKCALCGRDRDENFLKPEELKNKNKKIEEILNDLYIKQNKSEIKYQELLQSKMKITKTIEEKKNEIEDLRKILTGETTKNILEENRIIDDKIIKWKEKKINLSNYTENLRDLPEVKKNISQLKKLKKGFDAKFNFDKKIRNDWEKFVQFFMKKVGFEDEGNKVIELDVKTMLPTIDGKSWKDDLPDNQKHIYNLAMYYAFLKCSIIHSIKYPRYVMWDCWRTGELDKEKSNRIGEILSNLHNEYYKSFQMIIFTADEIIEGYIPPENILKKEFTKEREEYLFLENEVSKYSYPEQER